MSILSILKKYDEKFFAWLEGKGTTRPERNRKTSEDNHERSKVSDRRMVSKRNAIQIPDPWD